MSKVQYSTVPPTSGSHFVQPVLDGRQFYSSADTPAVETLVHNLEHGYTVLWYLPSEESARSGELQELAGLGNKIAPSQGKFIVAPWNDAYGQFPSGKKFALTHWSATTDSTGKVTAQAGHRQLCGDLSGEAVMGRYAQGRRRPRRRRPPCRLCRRHEEPVPPPLLSSSDSVRPRTRSTFGLATASGRPSPGSVRCSDGTWTR